VRDYIEAMGGSNFANYYLDCKAAFKAIIITIMFKLKWANCVFLSSFELRHNINASKLFSERGHGKIFT
jgi:hypothetical protein